MTTDPVQYIMLAFADESLTPVRRVILANFQDGLIYMAALVGILFAHEMGHFLVSVFYGIRTSLPYFLPLPFSPIGTLGAVIRLDGTAADRRQIFDIGLAGPIAGLLVAIPVLWLGVQNLSLNEANGYGAIRLQMPLGIVLLMRALGPEAYHAVNSIWLGHLHGNPLFLAGWVGFFLTGLNMVPVSQLDGGHVSYCLFGRWSWWIARAIVVIAIIYIVVAKAFAWSLMILLVLFLGPDHPPTRDDSAQLGVVRTVIGLISLLIPILCLPPNPIMQ
jgi:membrane-associated protease RseP (regulator of RpoE activity)